MIYVAASHWLLLLQVVFGTAKPQFPLPYPIPYPGIVHVVPGPPHPVPVPMPMPVPVGVPIPVSELTTQTTTTTTSKPQENKDDNSEPTIKIYVPWPSFPWSNMFPNKSLSIANFSLNLPPQLPYRLVPPAFPMPMPMPFPPPVVMVPIPPMINIKPRPDNRHPNKDDSCDSDSSSSDSDDSDDSDSSSSSSSERDKSKKKKKKGKYGIYRSNRRQFDRETSEEEVKPMLTYQSKNGDIKLEKRLSMKEAATLMDNVRRSETKMQAARNNDAVYQRRAQIMAQIMPKNFLHPTIGNSNKHLVFKVPNNKTIGNLTVSFNVN